MKSLIALAAFAASKAYAQTSYSTETYTSCESDTVTATTMVTTPCSHSSCTAMPTDAAKAGHVTTWVTSYTALCSDASANNYQKVYTTTVTESCTDKTPSWSHTMAGYVPPAWTTGPMVCTECGSAPVTMAHATYPMAVAPSGTVVPEKMQTPMATPMAAAPAAGSPMPAMPGASSPVAPAAASPAPMMPAASAPMMPAASAPMMPEASAPMMPEASAPMMPEASAPMMPAASAPMMPAASAPMIPAAPAGSAPAMPAAGAAMPSMPVAAGSASPVCPGPDCHENVATGSTPLTPASSPSPMMYEGGAVTMSQPMAAAVALVCAAAAAFCLL